MNDERLTMRPVTRVTGRSRETLDDALAVERALEIRIDGRPLVVTLRTPGDDADLVRGFLASEGVIGSSADLARLEVAPAACADEPDVAHATLAPGVAFDWTRLERNFAATAACGLCGRAHLESLRAGLRPVASEARFAPAAILDLSERLRGVQETFLATGGLHAAAWCDGPALKIRAVREDVGRHNAVDKVVGWRLAEGAAADPAGVLWVSGRAGAEIVLKAAQARMPVLAAVGAPSSLAVELAALAGLTLIGFLREGRMNVYSASERIEG